MLSKMFDKVFDSMNKAFDEMGKAFDNLGEELSKPLDTKVELRDGENEKTVTEVETKPDGTVVHRTTTVRRYVHKPVTQAEREANCAGVKAAGSHRGSPCQYCGHRSK